MRRTIIAARPAHAVYRAFGGQQPRRSFAATSSVEQVHPVGPFYEAVLRTPSQPTPKEEPPAPPKKAAAPAQEAKPAPKEQPAKPAAAAAPAAEPKPAQPTPVKAAPAPAPAQETKKAAAPTPAPAEEDKKPAKRTRKTTAKAKSVPPPLSHLSSPSSSPSPSPSPSNHTPPCSPKSTPTNTISSTRPPPSREEAAEEEEPPAAAPSQNAQEAEKAENPSSNIPLPQQADPAPAAAAANPASVIFGSKLAGPAERAERLARMRERSRLVAGVLVPPKPDEPDNCCMSGCVNCVWDRYRDEMEEWAARTAEAERRLRADEVGAEVGTTQEAAEAVERGRRGMELGVHEEVAERGGEEEEGAVRGMEMDGGRVVEGEGFWDEELYKNLPVGIREFMKQEKRLKEKHLREGTLGG